jgi:hypothetical protein
MTPQERIALLRSPGAPASMIPEGDVTWLLDVAEAALDYVQWCTEGEPGRTGLREFDVLRERLYAHENRSYQDDV